MEQRGIRAGVRRLFRLAVRRRDRVEREVDEELRFHVEMRVEQLVRRGLSVEEARAEAVRRLGDYDEAQRRLRSSAARRERWMQWREWLDGLRQDLSYAVRGLRRSPGFAAVVVVTLALGIGANAIMFGIVDRLLLRPPAHVVEPERVVRIYYRSKAPSWMPGREYLIHPVTTFPTVAALQRGVPSLQEVAAVATKPRTLGRGAEAREVDVSLVSGSFFRLLGTRPALGRFFAPDEDRLPIGERVAVLSHGFWRGHFDGSDGVVGREIVVDGEPFTIIGVAPEGFTGIDLENVDLWLPLSALAAKDYGERWHDTHNAIWLSAIARMRPGAMRERVSVEATLVYQQVRREILRDEPWRSEMEPEELPTVVAGPILAARGPRETPAEAKVSLWLVGVSSIVLLVACANIANLLLARAMQRRREIAVRLALGVGWRRLVRQLLAETLLLAGLAAAAALLLTHWGGALVRGVLLSEYALGADPIDARVLAFTAAVTLLTVILAGLVPSLQAGRTDVVTALKLGGGAGGGRRSRLRTGLLVAQAALSVVLLVGAGLFVRSLRQIRALDVGVDLERVLLVHADLSRVGIEGERASEIWRAAHDRVERLPGVERAALVRASVPKRNGSGMNVQIAGRDSLPDLPFGGPYYATVTADYLATLGARIVRGRGITESDEATGARVVLVNETIAEHWWRGENPLGACVTMGSDSTCTEVVGVVQDVLLFDMLEERSQIYLPITHPAFGAGRAPDAMLVRSAGDPATVAGLVRREVQSLTPSMPYVTVASFLDLVAPELRPWRLGATMFGIFGALALVIAAVGLYGVIAFAVVQRTHEIGVRMALGAAGARIVRSVLLDALRLVAAGFALGAIAALAAGRWIEPLLHETSPREPAVYLLVAATFAAVAVVASALPAWRASRVDPAEALRSD